MTRDFSNIMAQRLAEDTYLSIIWPVLSSCRLKFKICPEPWPTFFHSPRSSWPWAVTPVMLYKCHESRDWQLPYKRRDFGLRALSQRGPFVQRRRQNEQWCFTDKVSKNKTPRQGKYFLLANSSSKCICRAFFNLSSGICVFEQCLTGTKLFVLHCGAVYLL